MIVSRGPREVSVDLLANPVEEGVAIGLLLDQLVTQKHAELGNVALGRGIGGDHLEQAAAVQITHLLVQHHYRFGTVEPAGIQHGVNGQGFGGFRHE